MCKCILKASGFFLTFCLCFYKLSVSGAVKISQSNCVVMWQRNLETTYRIVSGAHYCNSLIWKKEIKVASMNSKFLIVVHGMVHKIATDFQKKS